MAEPPRIVIDTGVWISGIFFPRGTPGRVLAGWRNGLFPAIFTESTWAELESHLLLKAADFEAEPKLAPDWLAYIKTHAVFVTASGEITGVSRDPKDDQFLDAAVSG